MEISKSQILVFVKSQFLEKVRILINLWCAYRFEKVRQIHSVGQLNIWHRKLLFERDTIDQLIGGHLVSFFTICLMVDHHLLVKIDKRQRKQSVGVN